MTPFKVGDKVRWHFCAPGGYGAFRSSCDAVVTKVKKRIQIRIDDHHADTRRLARYGADLAWVTAEQLEHATSPDIYKTRSHCFAPSTRHGRSGRERHAVHVARARCPHPSSPPHAPPRIPRSRHRLHALGQDARLRSPRDVAVRRCHRGRPRRSPRARAEVRRHHDVPAVHHAPPRAHRLLGAVQALVASRHARVDRGSHRAHPGAVASAGTGRVTKRGQQRGHSRVTTSAATITDRYIIALRERAREVWRRTPYNWRAPTMELCEVSGKRNPVKRQQCSSCGGAEGGDATCDEHATKVNGGEE